MDRRPDYRDQRNDNREKELDTVEKDISGLRAKIRSSVKETYNADSASFLLSPFLSLTAAAMRAAQA